MNTRKCFVFIDLGRQALWKAKPEDPNPIYLKSLPDWCILSPLVHPTLPIGGNTFSSIPEVVGIGEGFAILRSHLIVFLVPSINVLQSLAPARTPDSLSYFLQDFLPSFTGDFVRKLRYITKQAGLPSEPGYGFSVGPDEPQIPAFPTASKQGNVILSAYELDTAITADSLLSADGLPSTESISIYDSLILDSIQALLERDYRRTLLYSAIAMETYASTVLEDSYSNSLNVDPSPPHLRIANFTVAGGNTQKKDPVFAYLTERSRTDFALLLHEIPLYLSGKSLLVDNEPLYQKAIRLYKTRNRIVHRGFVPEEDTNLFNFIFSDAKIGLQTALDVCYWFGMSEVYTLPGGDHIELQRPELNSPDS